MIVIKRTSLAQGLVQTTQYCALVHPGFARDVECLSRASAPKGPCLKHPCIRTIAPVNNMLPHVRTEVQIASRAGLSSPTGILVLGVNGVPTA
jgi:hypothetical protein